MKFWKMVGVIFYIITILIVGILTAQNTTQLAVSDSLRAKYWRAQYELCRDENAAALSRAKFVEAIKDLSAACGVVPPGTEVNLNGEGEPYCKVAQ